MTGPLNEPTFTRPVTDPDVLALVRKVVGERRPRTPEEQAKLEADLARLTDQELSDDPAPDLSAGVGD